MFALIIILLLLLESYAKYELAVCAIFANEDQGLAEWLNFHISVGVEKAYVSNLLPIEVKSHFYSYH